MSSSRFSAAHAVRTLVSAGILAAVVLWLTSPGLLPVDLGAADQLIGHPGVGRFLVGGPEGWRSLSAENPLADGAWPLPAGLIGLPALASDGGAVALTDAGLVVMGHDGEQRPGPELPPETLGDHWELIGLDASDRPVLGCDTPAGRRLLVVAEEGAGWQELVSQQNFASPPLGAEVLLSRSRRALAYRSEECWEVWVFGGSPARRFRAVDCTGRSAVFSPEGDALILDGRTDGIYRLDLDSGRISFMAKGNLGNSQWVPLAAGFRGDPLLMVAPVRDNEGYLQVMQTHLHGGGRFSITTGAVHHYLVTCSQKGRYLAYCQATFEEDKAGPIDEALYLFDFDVARAIYDDSRLGGGPLQGPLFVGDGPKLTFIAEGRLLMLDPEGDSGHDPGDD